MEQNFEMWIYRGAIIILLSVLWYLAKGVLKELKLIRGVLQALNISQVKQDGRIRSLEEAKENHERRLNAHSINIRTIENKQNQCQSCPR